MDNLVELSGQFVSNGEKTPFQLVILMPVQDGPTGDFLCQVVSQELFTRRMNVYGGSRNQAVRLAISIVRTALTSRLVNEVDQYGAEEE